jgi:hypothetical protein
MKRVAAIAFGLIGLASMRPAPAQTMDIREAFFAAIRSPESRYQGKLDGAFGDYARGALKTSAAFFVDVHPVDPPVTYSRADCKRLRAQITAPDLRWTDQSGVARSFEYALEMSVCLDGSPPNELALEAMKSLPPQKR